MNQELKNKKCILIKKITLFEKNEKLKNTRISFLKSMFTPNPLSLEMTSILCDFVSRITHVLSRANLSFSHLKLQPQQTISLFPEFGERDSCSFCQSNKAFYIPDTIYQELLLKNEIPRPQPRTIDLGLLEMEP